MKLSHIIQKYRELTGCFYPSARAVERCPAGKLVLKDCQAWDDEEHRAMEVFELVQQIVAAQASELELSIGQLLDEVLERGYDAELRGDALDLAKEFVAPAATFAKVAVPA